MVEQFMWRAAVTCLSLFLLRGPQQALSPVFWMAGWDCVLIPTPVSECNIEMEKSR